VSSTTTRVREVAEPEADAEAKAVGNCACRTCERGPKSCTIITCPPNAIAGTLHDRMPVILAPDDWGRWLGDEPASPDELKALLVPCPDEALKLWPVNRQKVGNVRNKERECAEPDAEALAKAG